MTVPIVEMIASSKVHAKPARSFSKPTATEARQKIEMIIQTTAKPNNKKRYPVSPRALSCCSKKSMLYGSKIQSN
jgi:hypothetical protein